MSLIKYKSEIKWLSDEIKQEFSEGEITLLYSKLKKMGLEEWWSWKSENETVIKQYVNATPSKRKTTKKYASLMPLLAYASYQHCLAGYHFLCKVEELEYCIGGSYRTMASESGEAFKDVAYHCDHELWPWGGPDPLLSK